MNTLSPQLVLGIETSCDDTAAALVTGEGVVLASVVSSQLDAHRPFGGVVPEIASREHLTNWPAVSAQVFEAAGRDLGDVDLVAATAGPGLIGALLVGLSLGKSIAYGLGKPFSAVHHLEAHLFSPFLSIHGEPAESSPDPFVGLVVSGGHTTLYWVEGVADSKTAPETIETLAETRDDAVGEVFDKIGKRLGLPYPQGPQVDQLAERGRAGEFSLPVARCSDDSLDFSYSGLKTQTLLALEKLNGVGIATAGDVPDRVCDLLAGFRQAAVDQLLDRLTRLYDRRPFGCLAVSGGAAANRLLRRRLPEWCQKRGVDLRLVPLQLSGDNAAMIAYAGLRRWRGGRRDDPLTAEPASRLAIG